MTRTLAPTRAKRPFLLAEWRRLCLVTYPVPPELLDPLVPPGLTLDLRDGTAYVSLVAFDFCRTRVLGVSWPGYRDFPEVNLRFYVRRGETRGVTFIRELVPKRLIAWTAKALYNEPYVAAKMTSTHVVRGDTLTVRHELHDRGRRHTLEIRAAAEAAFEPSNHTAEFFKEHAWGYGTSRGGKRTEYEVRHPVWRLHRVQDVDLDWDFGAVYGDSWRFLNDAVPHSVLLAEGSPVSVSPRL